MRADIEMLKQEKAKQSAVFQNRKGQFLLQTKENPL
jgi:hypothetical protein